MTWSTDLSDSRVDAEQTSALKLAKRSGIRINDCRGGERWSSHRRFASWVIYTMRQPENLDHSRSFAEPKSLFSRRISRLTYTYDRGIRKMSRFSRKTATGLGYLLFAMVGGVSYLTLKTNVLEDERHALRTSERESVKLNIDLGASIESATEILPTAVAVNRFDDPIVELESTQRPKWAKDHSLVPIESLVSKPVSAPCQLSILIKRFVR